MPELPEVQALVTDLRSRLLGHTVDTLQLVSFAALKTFDPPVSALHGLPVTSVERHGKYLGPDPLDAGFTVDVLAGILAKQGRAQIKGVLRSQSIIAGIGNAYSDEILHAAKMSPFKPASMTPDEVQRLYDALQSTLRAAVARADGLAASELKHEKKTNLQVHGRAGEPCPVCGDTVRQVRFADSTLEYCPTCQTGGKPLAAAAQVAARRRRPSAR